MAETACTRREALRRLASILVGAGVACEQAPAPLETSVPLVDLADGRRVRVLVGGKPVEVTQAGDVVTARYLVCTHMGCLVKWDDLRARYVCPCHDGLFAANGRPVAGPATEPLVEVPFEIAAGHVVFRL